MKYIPFFLALIVVVLPGVVSAQGGPGGLVPCEGADCTACSVVQLANGMVRWLISILMVIFAIITMYAGFELVTSGGNPQAKTKAKQKMINAFIGLIIVLAAWILVDTLMRAILAGGTGEIEGRLWSEVSCVGQGTVSEGPVPVVPVAPPAEGGGINPVDMINGRCGDAHTVGTETMPSGNLCSTETDPSVITSVTGGAGDPWQWKCGNASCFAGFGEDGPPPVAGANGCGPVPAVVPSKPATADLCLLGGTHRWSAENPGEGQKFSWICGTDIPTISCNATYNPNAVVAVECGPADGVPSYSFPAGSSNLCTGPDGTFPVTDGESLGYYRWTCRNAGTPEVVSCSAALSVGNSCSSGYKKSEGGESYSLPSSRCSKGTYQEVNVSGIGVGQKYTWACVDGGGDPAFCESTKIAPPPPECPPFDPFCEERFID
jgi:hypothetical protein